jgi:hypothetical protein
MSSPVASNRDSGVQENLKFNAGPVDKWRQGDAPMEIGPITAVRPVTMIKPSRSAPDLSHVFEVEYLGQSGDDEYTPANGNVARGLEDEEEDIADDTADAEAGSETVVSLNKVSFFA